MLTVVKIGGSVLRDDAAYANVAAWLTARLEAHESERIVVIVSARHGVTDALLEAAERTAARPARAALDLLWSTGETASVAWLALHLQACGVSAAPLNVHQAGLRVCDTDGRAGDTSVRPLRLLATLRETRIAIVPGFFAVRPGGAIASLGRGGSDLTAVLLAAALEADRCELVKDVAGYFTADPHANADACQIRELSIDAAIDMAAAGCDLVQRAALEAARDHRLPLLVRCLDASAPVTHVQPARSAHGVCDQDHSRRAAVRA